MSTVIIYDDMKIPRQVKASDLDTIKDSIDPLDVVFIGGFMMRSIVDSINVISKKKYPNIQGTVLKSENFLTKELTNIVLDDSHDIEKLKALEGASLFLNDLVECEREISSMISLLSGVLASPKAYTGWNTGKFKKEWMEQRSEK